PYDPASDSVTDLEQKIQDAGLGSFSVSALAYDSFNHAAYLLGQNGGSPATAQFFRYDPDSSAPARNPDACVSGICEYQYVNDAQLFLDATGYAAIVNKDDGLYDSVTSYQPTTGFTTSFPMFMYKVKDANADPSLDAISVQWDGISSTAQKSTASTTLEIFNLSTSSWEIKAFDKGDTDTVKWGAIGGAGGLSWSLDPLGDPAITAMYFDSASTVYVRVAQNVSNTSTRSEVLGLHADRFTVTFTPFAPSTDTDLVMRAALFENDNGTTPDTNTITASGSPALTVEKGQRFVIRFRVNNNTDTATTAQFNVQFDHNDGAYKSVSSGEISVSLGLSGQAGDAITSPGKTSGACSGANFNNGKWHEDTATSDGIVINNGASQCTELAFIFSTATATVNQVYNLRLVTATSNRPFGASATASIQIISSQYKKHSKGAFNAFDGFTLNREYAITDQDPEYYLDASGYKAIAYTDFDLDTVTSSATSVNYGTATSATARPSFVFKIRNARGNNTDPILFNWTGQTSSSALPIAVQAYKYGTAWGSATGWLTVTTVNLQSGQQNANISATATLFSSIMSDYYTTDNFTSWRVMQSHVATSWAYWAPFTPYALRTDIATTTFASLNLNQSGFVFENDDGDTADGNTSTGSVNTILKGVRRGERLNLRIAVSSTADILLYQKRFQLQYAATSTNAITTSADCANFATSSPFWTPIGIGATSVIPAIAGISPTSINVSLANAFQHNDGFNAPKLMSTDNFLYGRTVENVNVTEPITLTTNKGLELVYAIQTGEMMPAANVCFRVVMEENGDTENGRIEVLSGYNQYPALSIRTETENAQRFSKGVQREREDTAIDLTSRVSGIIGTNSIGASVMDIRNRVVYMGTNGGNFFKYDPATDTATDLTTLVSAIFGANAINDIAVDAFQGMIYIGGGTSNLVQYDPAANTVKDLSPFIATFWGSNVVNRITYDSHAHTVYLGGGTGATVARFARFDPASNTATDLSAPLVVVWGNIVVVSLDYNNLNREIYLVGATSRFAKYTPSANAFTGLTTKVSNLWGGQTLRAVVYDPFGNVIYLSGNTGKFAKYDPRTEAVSDLTEKISPFWSTDIIYGLLPDPFHNTVYLAGANAKFARYDDGLATAGPNTATGTAVNLSAKITGWGANAAAALSYDPHDRTLYLGGGNGVINAPFSRFSPSLSKNTDNLLFFDESDYSAVGTSPDNIFSSVTSYPHASVGTQSITSYPSFLFKQKADHTGDRITISWTGQTTTTVQPVYLQVYDHNVTEGVATSTTAWKTIAFRSATSINTNFTLSGTLTENFPVPNAGTTTRYFTKHQNGVDPLASTTITLRVYQEHQT
ncbi:MAG: hypothetical protein HY420_00945, partial [Candidatus Kerfeldbacteria bacterium]|nr:hypothetical protein [Candidatus Kerfeldbacteria bacterium]